MPSGRARGRRGTAQGSRLQLVDRLELFLALLELFPHFPDFLFVPSPLRVNVELGCLELAHLSSRSTHVYDSRIAARPFRRRRSTTEPQSPLEYGPLPNTAREYGTPSAPTTRAGAWSCGPRLVPQRSDFFGRVRLAPLVHGDRVLQLPPLLRTHRRQPGPPARGPRPSGAHSHMGDSHCRRLGGPRNE